MKTLILVAILAAVPVLSYAAAPAMMHPAQCGAASTQCQMASMSGPMDCAPVSNGAAGVSPSLREGHK